MSAIQTHPAPWTIAAPSSCSSASSCLLRCLCAADEILRGCQSDSLSTHQACPFSCLSCPLSAQEGHALGCCTSSYVHTGSPLQKTEAEPHCHNKQLIKVLPAEHRQEGERRLSSDGCTACSNC